MKLIIGFILYFIMVFVVASLVTFLFNLIIHGSGNPDWNTAFTFAIILGIIFSWMNVRQKKKKK